MNTIDITSYAKYPYNLLSNFAHHKFTFRKIPCNSMEGLLQSFKYKDVEKQKEICLLKGKRAKQAGYSKTGWIKSRSLWVQGKKVDRDSRWWQFILDEAYAELSKSTTWCAALLNTGSSKLIHTIGSNDPQTTILTQDEFCNRLMSIRQILNGEIKEHESKQSRHTAKYVEKR